MTGQQPNTPDIDPDAVRELYAELLEADQDGASSNDWTQIIDDWFTGHGFPTILYRPAEPKRSR